MQILEAFQTSFVGKMYPSKLKRILRDLDSVYVKKAANGVLVLSDNTVIKCVNQYYMINVRSSSNSPLVTCRNIKHAIGLDGIDICGCRACHLACLEREERNELTRKKVR